MSVHKDVFVAAVQVPAGFFFHSLQDPSPSQSSKYRERIFFRTQCSATITTTVLDTPSLESLSNSVTANRPWTTPISKSSTVLDLEKLHLPSLEADSSLTTTIRPWTYTRGVGPPVEANFEGTLSTENLTGDKAVIAATAAEAVALARTAAKVA